MSKLVTIFGGSGFIGRYIAKRLAAEGWRVRVAVRKPNLALFVRTYGAVGQVEPVFCDITDEESVRLALRHADAAVNCVGTFDSRGANAFDPVQHRGAERIARLAAEAGIARLVHISAIGADPDSESDYARTKALGEAAVLAHMPEAMILRPSVVFGPEDNFFNRFAAMARFTPVLPLVGAETRFQPVYVDDVAAAAVKGVTGEVQGGIYELGGPEVATFRELIHEMLRIIRRRRLVVDVPFPIARIVAGVLDLVEVASFGLVRNTILTPDQVRALKVDNVVAENAQGFAALGIEPCPMEVILPDYLWRFRPAGQFEEFMESARNLRH